MSEDRSSGSRAVLLLALLLLLLLAGGATFWALDRLTADPSGAEPDTAALDSHDTDDSADAVEPPTERPRVRIGGNTTPDDDGADDGGDEGSDERFIEDGADIDDPDSLGADTDVVVAPPSDEEFSIENAIVHGLVLSGVDGAPIVGASVEVRDWFDVVDGPSLRFAERNEGIGSREVTGTAGRYRVQRVVGLGRIVLTIRAPGFATYTMEYEDTSSADEAIQQNVTLEAAGRIEGVVLRPNSTPAPGAHVHAVEIDAVNRRRGTEMVLRIRDLLFEEGRWDETVHYRRSFTVADEQGRYTFEDVRFNTEYVVFALSEDDGLSEFTDGVYAASGETTTPVEIRLRERSPVVIQFFDGVGVPRADADCEVWGDPRGKYAGDGWAPYGGDRIRHMELDPGPQRVVLSTENSLPVGRTIDVVPGQENTFEIRAPDGGVIDVLVLTSGGAPIANASVHLYMWDEPEESDSVWAETDSDGRHRFVGVPVGPLDVGVTHAQFEGADQTFAGVPDKQVEFRLHPASTRWGVVHPSGGLPRTLWLYYATRRSGDPNAPWRDEIEEWVEGKCEFDQIPLGGAELVVWAIGFKPTTVELDLRAGEDEKPLPDITLEPAPTRRVRVLDEDGNPISGASVAITVDHPCVDEDDLEKFTDDRGYATVELPLGDAQEFSVSAEGREAVWVNISSAPADAPPLEVRLPARD